MTEVVFAEHDARAGDRLRPDGTRERVAAGGLAGRRGVRRDRPGVRGRGRHHQRRRRLAARPARGPRRPLARRRDRRRRSRAARAGARRRPPSTGPEMDLPRRGPRLAGRAPDRSVRPAGRHRRSRAASTSTSSCGWRGSRSSATAGWIGLGWPDRRRRAAPPSRTRSSSTRSTPRPAAPRGSATSASSCSARR